ncbi:FHA domain-containing protein [Posidoniimonas corsicana]|nr:FHA domain-containing protein [Posidoniimonas corsicana]
MSTETQAAVLATAAPLGALQLSASDWEQGFLLPEGPTSIGAGPKCDLRLDAPGLKPLHCVVVLADGAATVRRWSPGTKLNGSTFTEAPLHAGDCLSIGPVDLHLLPVESSGAGYEVETSAGADLFADGPNVGDDDLNLSEHNESTADDSDNATLVADQLATEESGLQAAEPAGLLEHLAFEDADEVGEEAAYAEELAAPTYDSEKATQDEPSLAEHPLDSGAEESVTDEPSATDEQHDLQPEKSDDSEAEGTKDTAITPPGASVSPVPPHLLKPWEDANRESAAAAEEAEETDEAACPAEDEATDAEVSTDTHHLVTVPEGVEPEPTGEGADEAAESNDDCPAGTEDPDRFEFYTDVNWKSVEAVAAQASGHAGLEAGDGIPTPHPIDLASMLRGQERLTAVRSRAKRLVESLRAERQRAAETTDQLSHYIERCEELSACVDELRATLADRDAQYASLEAEKAALDGELDGLRQKVESQDAVNQELRDQLAEQAEKIASLSAAIESWEAERESLAGELSAAQEQLRQRAEEAAVQADEAELPEPSDDAAEAGVPSEAAASDASIEPSDADWSVSSEATEPPTVSEVRETEDTPEPTPTEANSDEWLAALPGASTESTEPTAETPAEDEEAAFLGGKTTPIRSGGEEFGAKFATHEPVATEEEESQGGADEVEPVDWRLSGGDADSVSDAGAEQSEEESPLSGMWDVAAKADEPATTATPAIDPAGMWDIERTTTEEPQEQEPAAEESDSGVAEEGSGMLPLAQSPPEESVSESEEQLHAPSWEVPVPPQSDATDNDPALNSAATVAEQVSDDGEQVCQEEGDPAGPRSASPIPDWLMDDSDDEEEPEGHGPAAEADETPTAAFEAPKSFVEQYAHLLPAEDGPDAEQQSMPEPAPAVPAPEPAAESADPDEEDIDAYMSRLMERMRGGINTAPEATEKPAASREQQQAVEPTPTPEAPAPAKQPIMSLDEIKRSVQPEQSTDMASLRRLANDSARQAIGVAASKHSREQSIANLVIASIAMASGGYLIASAPAVFSTQLVGGAFALLLAGVWVFRSLAHLLQSVRTGGSDGALQERLNAEKLPINK